jgi:hypothetical protein
VRRSNLWAMSAALTSVPFWRDLLHHFGILAGAFQHFGVLIFGAIALMIRKYVQRVRENRAAMWPSADGLVQTATVKKEQFGSWVEISYRYYAQQEYRYGKYRRHFARKAAAEAFAEAIRGRSIQVRFREDKPSESVVLEQDLQMTGVLQLG